MTAGRYAYDSDYWVNKEKECNNKAEEISSQDCKQQCDVAELREDCAKCIGEHKEYDSDCKEDMNLIVPCLETVFPPREEEGECREKCKRDVTDEACEICAMNHQDAGLNCRIIMGYRRISNYWG